MSLTFYTTKTLLLVSSEGHFYCNDYTQVTFPSKVVHRDILNPNKGYTVKYLSYFIPKSVNT